MVLIQHSAKMKHPVALPRTSPRAYTREDIMAINENNIQLPPATKGQIILIRLFYLGLCCLVLVEVYLLVHFAIKLVEWMLSL